MELSVVIPAYLEEENLRLLLPRLREVVESLQVKGEIIIVDTQAPMDNTREVCVANGARYVARSGGNTYGCAVRSGIAASIGKHVVFMDADGSHAPEFVKTLFQQANNADIVIASRYVEGGATENPGALILMSRVLNLLYTFFLGIRCRDVSNSFKLYQGDVLRKLELRCENFDIVEEILVRYAVAQRKLRIVEIPFVFKKRMFGETKRNLLEFVITFALTLLRLMWVRFANARFWCRKQPKISEVRL
jgi:dolichol-phosphate mannosyltransferase